MSEEPRPALVSTGELFGGAERHLLGLATWLQRQGHRPLLVLFHDHELARQARAAGIDPVVLDVSGPYDLRGPGRLAEVVRRHGINVVHAHSYRAVVNAALARRRCAFAMVRTVHGMLEHRGLGPAALRSRIYRGLEVWGSRRCGALVCYVTDDLRRRHRDEDRGLETRTIHNGIDPLDREDYPRPAEYETGRFNLVAVGRLIPVKGLDFMLEAMARLPAGGEAVLHLVGTGTLALQLERQARALGLADRVRFLGFKSNVYDYIAHADLLVMPSRHEGLPYTILEAMSLEVPILASRVGGLAEILEDGRDAVLVGVGDVEGLAAAVRGLAADPQRAAALGAAGRRRQVRDLDLDAMGGAYWQAYGDALSGRLVRAAGVGS